MKLILTAAALAALSIPAHARDFGKNAQLDAMGCTGSAIAQAVRGDFSAWVLPDVVPGNHLRAGQYVEAETGADGVRRCVVRGG